MKEASEEKNERGTTYQFIGRLDSRRGQAPTPPNRKMPS